MAVHCREHQSRETRKAFLVQRQETPAFSRTNWKCMSVCYTDARDRKFGSGRFACIDLNPSMRDKTIRDSGATRGRQVAVKIWLLPRRDELGLQFAQSRCRRRALPFGADKHVFR